MHILFTRHGESQANLERIISNRDLPHPLTEKGRTQTLGLLAKLAGRQIGAIYASPILRAQQTAQIVAKQLALPVITSAALREFDCGLMEGRGDPAAWAAHHAIIARWAEGQHSESIPGGESFLDMQARFVPFVEQLIHTHAAADQDILLISHGSMLHHMLPLVLPNVDRDFVAEHPLGNCAIVTAAVAGGRLHCREWDGWVFA